MSRTITISDETFEALQEKIKELEREEENAKKAAKEYPIAAISLQGGARLILNLPDVYLSDNYKGCVFAVNEDGDISVKALRRHTYLGKFYTGYDEKQIFPIVK